MPRAAATTTPNAWARRGGSRLPGAGQRVEGIGVHPLLCLLLCPAWWTRCNHALALPAPHTTLSLALWSALIVSSLALHCPTYSKLHTCAKCGSGRDSCADKALELVPCRRCPLAYHRRCLPAEMQRARDKVEGARVWLADQDESKGAPAVVDRGTALACCR